MSQDSPLLETLQNQKTKVKRITDDDSLFPFIQSYVNEKNDLNNWKSALINKTNLIHKETLSELEVSYEELNVFRNSIISILDNLSMAIVENVTIDEINQI
ncbi:unnamed protein product [Didymodactylos carnosus]|uniref:Uncharacterized protein n=1 Tax=Didymodactylos carnosus TaxID=1234261 RepID=A0A814F2W1_9BILA|nr:unnamed protein product [Didymodactylos carnosus]CAF3747182.1 unnamed protein product [Didymodactylos carnosus]